MRQSEVTLRISLTRDSRFTGGWELSCDQSGSSAITFLEAFLEIDPLLVAQAGHRALGRVTLFGALNAVTYFTLRQRAVPNGILGRTVAVTRLIAFSTIPLGAVAGGLLYEYAGVTAVIACCALIRIAAGLLASLSPLVSQGQAVVAARRCFGCSGFRPSQATKSQARASGNRTRYFSCPVHPIENNAIFFPITAMAVRSARPAPFLEQATLKDRFDDVQL